MKKRSYPEYDLQCAAVQYFRTRYPGVVHHATGAPRVGARAMMALKRMGYCKGFPDLLIFKRVTYEYPQNGRIQSVRYCGLAIEFKKPKTKVSRAGVVSPEQVATMTALEMEGWKCAVCDNIDDAVYIINEYMSRRK